MKIRLGFISNSSSSSFTCDICGQTESGWDMSLSDAEMVESRYGMYCERYLLKPLDEIVEEINEKEEDDYCESDIRSEIPDKYCPLYNLIHISDQSLLKYLLKKNGLTEKQLVEDIRAKFKNLDELTNYLKK